VITIARGDAPSRARWSHAAGDRKAKDRLRLAQALGNPERRCATAHAPFPARGAEPHSLHIRKAGALVRVAPARAIPAADPEKEVINFISSLRYEAPIRRADAGHGCREKTRKRHFRRQRFWLWASALLFGKAVSAIPSDYAVPVYSQKRLDLPQSFRLRRRVLSVKNSGFHPPASRDAGAYLLPRHMLM
jgi:hypothetical protein